jgi:hypothetical protein
MNSFRFVCAVVDYSLAEPAEEMRKRPMTWKNCFFFVPLLAALTGCVGSIAPVAKSSETDDALLGTWRGCQGTKLEVTRADADVDSGGYAMKFTDRQTHKAVTYRLVIQRIGNEEFVDAFYAPRHAEVDQFSAVHWIALIRHDGNDVLVQPLNEEWWKPERLEGSGLLVKEIGDFTVLIVGTSSDLRAFLAAHAHHPDAFLTGDEDRPYYGRLKRRWTTVEAAGCNEDL